MRRPVLEDFKEVKAIADSYDFPLPTDFSDAIVVESEKKVIAFGVIRFICEAIILVSGRQRDKAKCIEALLQQGIEDARKRKVDQLHCFVVDPMFSKILKNKFGFRQVIGEALVLDLEIENGKE